MNLFHHHIHFGAVDPLANGLADEIAAEQAEPDAFVLEEQLDETLADRWQVIIDDAKQDKDYIDLMRSIDE
ncbi:MAG TPA: hypothetical protein VGE34_00175 [Candidatus Saccharimonadales bacterium]